MAKLRKAELENLERLVNLIPTSNSNLTSGSPIIHRETGKTPRATEHGNGDIGRVLNPISQAPDSLDHCQAMIPAEDPLDPASLDLAWYDEFQCIGLTSEHILAVVNQLSEDGFHMEENVSTARDDQWFWGAT